MSESIENAGDKIAAALKQNSTSWVAAKIASLYWRVKGRAQEALECLRVALTYAPDSAKVSGRIEYFVSWHRGYKTFFMLSSAGTKISTAHKC